MRSRTDFNEGFFPTYNASVIKSKIGFTTSVSKKNKNGFSSMASVFNNSRAGAIYESAGRNGNQGQPWVGPNGPAGNRYSHSRNPKAGEQFIGSMPELSGSLKGRGRLILKAWAQDQGKAYGAALKAIDKSERKFYDRSKTTTFSKAA